MPTAPMHRLIAVAVLSCLGTGTTAGQTPPPALIGTVIDTLGHPLGYSLVTLFGQHGRQRQIAARADGNFVFDSAAVFAFVPHGPYSLRVQAIGFAKSERTFVPLLRGKTVVVNFRLSPWNETCDLLLSAACAIKRPQNPPGFVVLSAEARETGVLRPGDTLKEINRSLLLDSQRKVLRQVADRIGAPVECARAFRGDTIVLLHILPVCGREEREGEYLKDWANLIVGTKGQIIDSGPRVAWSLGTLCPSGRGPSGQPYYGLVWMLDGCARLNLEKPLEQLAPGVATRYGVILPDPVRRGILHQCSRDTPSSADFEWVPSPEQIAEVERLLPTYVADSQLLAPLASYRRQYGGFGVGSDSMIYVNLWIPFREDTDTSYWHRVPVDICDGGKMAFGVVYDVRRHRFARIDFNGEG